jgi:hypothetical protein
MNGCELIFPDLREFATRLKEIWQKHGVFSSIEMLDAFRYGKINPSGSCFATMGAAKPGLSCFPSLAAG